MYAAFWQLMAVIRWGIKYNKSINKEDTQKVAFALSSVY